MQRVENILRSFLRLVSVIATLVTSVPFIAITVVGNSIIFAYAFVFYTLEVNINEKVASLLDAVWWSFSTATTVGYGDIIPVSAEGKILGITLMLLGTALFVTYTAIFSQAILSDDMLQIRKMSRTEQRQLAHIESILEKIEKIEKKVFD
jgi:voltage-gated potassium channel